MGACEKESAARGGLAADLGIRQRRLEGERSLQGNTPYRSVCCVRSAGELRLLPEVLPKKHSVRRGEVLVVEQVLHLQTKDEVVMLAGVRTASAAKSTASATSTAATSTAAGAATTSATTAWAARTTRSTGPTKASLASATAGGHRGA